MDTLGTHPGILFKELEVVRLFEQSVDITAFSVLCMEVSPLLGCPLSEVSLYFQHWLCDAYQRKCRLLKDVHKREYRTPANACRIESHA